MMMLKRDRNIEWLFAILFLIAALLLFTDMAKAECAKVWKPGDTIYIAPGHAVRIIVESEDVAQYRAVRLPDELKPMPSPIGPNNPLQAQLDKDQHARVCNDYTEITDLDLE